jgi:Uma2 family endonuclease
VKAFHQACERKAWGDGKRMILIRGELFEVPPMKPLHATGIRLVNAVLPRVFPAEYVIQVQLPLVLDLETDPIPDFAVVAGDVRTFLTAHPTTASLVVEIASTSLDADLTTKAELYATAMITEYWVLDLHNRRLYVLRDPVPVPGNGVASYRTQLTYAEADTVSPLAVPDKSIKVADLLP